MHKLLLPSLGQTMEEGLLTRWLVENGSSFKAGEPLYEVETEKVTTEVEATLPGTFVRVVVEEESSILVGTLLAVVADPGERPDDATIEAFINGSALSAPAPDTDSPAVAEENASATMVGTAPLAADADALAASKWVAQGVTRAMPRTRKIAKEHGLDITTVHGTGGEGLVTELDVHAELAARRASAESPVAAPPRTSSTPERVPLHVGVPVKETRKLSAVARRMAQVTGRSWAQVPQFSQTMEVQAPHWRRSRDALREKTGIAFGYTDMVIESLIGSLREVPEANSSFDGDSLLVWEDINISIAVDTPGGLQVPVLQRAQQYDMVQRADAMRGLVERARMGKLTGDDVSGGTITLSNLGMFGIEGGFPMVTAPQSAVVFIGAMRDAVVAVNGAIMVCPVFTVANSFDHRALDGATAARFTAALTGRLSGWK
jgi:pyruvate dehydrogenase E2 component (dihydrolipoamide acetyltransferase)